MKPRFFYLLVCALLSATLSSAREPLEKIAVSPEGSHFIHAKTGTKFTPWGFNYDRDDAGRLLEDYWHEEWATVEEDFREMKDLGANVVRLHLQFGKFMDTEDRADARSLAQLQRLLDLAGRTGLYLDLTGLGCYHRQDIPAWYDGLEEAARWKAQAVFWQAIAETAKDRPEVFCYNLMNEPLAPGGTKRETEWLAGELAGKHYVQRVTLDPAGRESREVARQWIKQLAEAIRAHDRATLLTVGVIPWSMTFPGAKPVFHSPEAGGPLDFVSVHVYPEAGKLDRALEALAVHDMGKPIVIEEIFPLKCGVEELGRFIDRATTAQADGWIGFYWGKRPEEYAEKELAGALMRGWLEFFRKRAATMTSTR